MGVGSKIDFLRSGADWRKMKMWVKNIFETESLTINVKDEFPRIRTILK